MSHCSWHGKMRCLQSWRCRRRRAFQRQRKSGRGVSLPGVSLFCLCLCPPFFHHAMVYHKHCLFLPMSPPSPFSSSPINQLIKKQFTHIPLTTDKRQEKLRLEAAAGRGPGGGGSGGGGTDTLGPTRHPTEEMDIDIVGAPPHPPPTPTAAAADGCKDKEGKEGKEGKDASQHPPGKKYRLMSR